MSKYLIHNGELKLSQDCIFDTNNRAFNYGDGFFETIRCLSSKPLFFENHYLRIQDSLHLLKLKLSTEFTASYFCYQIEKLLQKNRIYKGARVKIVFYRETGGLYTPANNKGKYVMVSEPLDSEYFVLGKGITAGIYNLHKKTVDELAGLKSCSAVIYVLAGLWKKENNLDYCFILNQYNKIVEGLSSNIFLVKDNAIVGTTDDCGCVKGTMRKTIINISEQCFGGIKMTDGFNEKDILSADEVLFTNAIQGVAFLTAYKSRRYYSSVAQKLIDKLNLLIS